MDDKRVEKEVRSVWRKREKERSVREKELPQPKLVSEFTLIGGYRHNHGQQCSLPHRRPLSLVACALSSSLFLSLSLSLSWFA